MENETDIEKLKRLGENCSRAQKEFNEFAKYVADKINASKETQAESQDSSCPACVQDEGCK